MSEQKEIEWHRGLNVSFDLGVGERAVSQIVKIGVGLPPRFVTVEVEEFPGSKKIIKRNIKKHNVRLEETV